MTTYALLSGDRVVNLIVLDEGSEWTPDDGHTLAPTNGQPVNLGDIYDGVGGFGPPPAPVPSFITPNQARKALRALGFKAAVDAYVQTLDEDAQDDWEYATTIRRDNPIIAAGAAALSLSAAQVDDLFRLGATL